MSFNFNNDDEEFDEGLKFGQELFGSLGKIEKNDLDELRRIAETGDSPMRFIERLEKKGIQIPKHIKILAEKFDYKLEHVDFLTDEEVKLFNDFNNLTKELETIHKRAELKKELFWNHVRDRLELYDEKELSIDPLTQSVQRRVKD